MAELPRLGGPAVQSVCLNLLQSFSLQHDPAMPEQWRLTAEPSAGDQLQLLTPAVPGLGRTCNTWRPSLIQASAGSSRQMRHETRVSPVPVPSPAAGVAVGASCGSDG